MKAMCKMCTYNIMTMWCKYKETRLPSFFNKNTSIVEALLFRLLQYFFISISELENSSGQTFGIGKIQCFTT